MVKKYGGHARAAAMAARHRKVEEAKAAVEALTKSQAEKLLTLLIQDYPKEVLELAEETRK